MERKEDPAFKVQFQCDGRLSQETSGEAEVLAEEDVLQAILPDRLHLGHGLYFGRKARPKHEEDSVQSFQEGGETGDQQGGHA